MPRVPRPLPLVDVGGKETGQEGVDQDSDLEDFIVSDDGDDDDEEASDSSSQVDNQERQHLPSVNSQESSHSERTGAGSGSSSEEQCAPTHTLYCTRCERHLSLDNFSEKQQRVSEYSGRYCLKHSGAGRPLEVPPGFGKETRRWRQVMQKIGDNEKEGNKQHETESESESESHHPQEVFEVESSHDDEPLASLPGEETRQRKRARRIHLDDDEE